MQTRVQSKPQKEAIPEIKSDKYSKKVLTVPNLLSFIRLAMIPLIVFAYIILNDYVLSAVLLVLSGFTDALDGFIARRFNMISELGKALDPIADKLTQASVLLCLVSRFPFILSAFSVLIIKEFFNGLGNLKLINSTGRVHGALWHGKLCTALLYAVMFIHIVWYNIPESISYLLIGLSIAVMVLSSVLYTLRNIKYKK